MYKVYAIVLPMKYLILYKQYILMPVIQRCFNTDGSLLYFSVVTVHIEYISMHLSVITQTTLVYFLPNNFMPAITSVHYFYDIVINIWMYVCIYLVYILHVLVVLLDCVIVMFNLAGQHITLFLMFCVFHILCAIHLLMCKEATVVCPLLAGKKYELSDIYYYYF